MYQAKVRLKMLILLLVVFMGFITSSSIIAESPVPPTKPLYGTTQTIRIDPQPELGFFYPYYLLIPNNTRTDTSVYILVEPTNTGTRTDDLTIQEQKTKSTLENGYPSRIAGRMGIPLLMPVFPRPDAQPFLYTHALDRDSLLVKEGSLRRIDLQLIAMIHHAQKLLREKGLLIQDKVLLDGFSASGKFVNRFAFLHPNNVKAVACGGMNSTPMLPFAKLDGEKLIYPIGVYDLKELTGSEFQFSESKKVPQYIYQGRLDTNDTLTAPECFGPEEVRLITKVLNEKMMPERWEAAEHWYQKAKVSAQFVIYDETAHEVKDEIIYDVIRFFQANMGEKFVPIQPYVYSPVYSPVPYSPISELKKVHINDILLLGSRRIPAFVTTKDYHFIICIADWIKGDDYRQLTRFISNAGFSFEIIDSDSGKAICEIDKKNTNWKFSSGNGDFQGYAVKLSEEQIAKLKDGKTYTLRPLNSSDTYQWLNDKGVSFVWNVIDSPAGSPVDSPASALQKVHIKDILLSDKLPAGFTLKPQDFHLFISIAEWIPDQNYMQLRRFVSDAGFNFKVIDVESGAVVFEITKSNNTGRLSSDDGNFQGYVVFLGQRQLEMLKDGKTYTLKPLNSSDIYQWLIDKGVSFVWKVNK